MPSDHIAIGAYDDKCNSCNMYVGNKGDSGEPGERGDPGDRGPRGLLGVFVVATSSLCLILHRALRYVTLLLRILI